MASSSDPDTMSKESPKGLRLVRPPKGDNSPKLNQFLTDMTLARMQDLDINGPSGDAGFPFLRQQYSSTFNSFGASECPNKPQLLKKLTSTDLPRPVSADCYILNLPREVRDHIHRYVAIDFLRKEPEVKKLLDEQRASQKEHQEANMPADKVHYQVTCPCCTPYMLCTPEQHQCDRVSACSLLVPTLSLVNSQMYQELRETFARPHNLFSINALDHHNKKWVKLTHNRVYFSILNTLVNRHSWSLHFFSSPANPPTHDAIVFAPTSCTIIPPFDYVQNPSQAEEAADERIVRTEWHIMKSIKFAKSLGWNVPVHRLYTGYIELAFADQDGGGCVVVEFGLPFLKKCASADLKVWRNSIEDVKEYESVFEMYGQTGQAIKKTKKKPVPFDTAQGTAGQAPNVGAAADHGPTTGQATDDQTIISQDATDQVTVDREPPTDQASTAATAETAVSEMPSIFATGAPDLDTPIDVAEDEDDFVYGTVTPVESFEDSE